MNSEPLTQQELKNEVENVTDNFCQLLSRISTQELNRVVNKNTWTAGQVTEHIIKSNGGIISKLLNGNVSEISRPYNQQVELIQNIFRSDDKMKTAPVLEPGLPPHDLEDLLQQLKKHKEQQVEIINQRDLKELCTELQFPPAPEGLTRYEWIVFMIEHTERHRKQIKNLINRNP